MEDITVAPKPGNLCAGPETDVLPGVLCLNVMILLDGTSGFNYGQVVL